MILTSPLDDAFTYLFEEFLVLRKSEWRADKEGRAVKAFMKKLQEGPDKALEYVSDTYVNPRERAAFVEALGKYTWNSEVGEVRRIGKNDSHRWDGTDTLIGNKDIYDLLVEFQDDVDSEIYDNDKIWRWMQRDTELAEHIRNGVPCPHCDHGEKEIRLKGSQETRMIECRKCSGTGLYHQGGKTSGQRQAANIRQQLSNAGHNAWTTEPTERTVQDELRLMEMSNDDSVRNLARDPNVRNEARRMAVQRAKAKALLPDPRTLDYNERQAELVRLRASIGQMMAWERVESIMENEQSIYDPGLFPQNEYQHKLPSEEHPHYGIYDTLYEDVNNQIWGTDEAPNTAMRKRMDEIVASKKAAYEGQNFDEGRAQTEAFNSIMNPRLAKALFRYFYPYCMKAVEENINYITTKEYLNKEGLDVRVHPEDMDIIEQVRAEKAGGVLKEFWNIATGINDTKMPTGVNIRINREGEEEIVTSQDDNFTQIENKWRQLVSGSIDEQAKAKLMLATQVELNNGDTLPLLSFIFYMGESNGKLDRGTVERFAKVMAKYPHPISKREPEWKNEKALSKFLSVKSGKTASRARGLEQSQTMGEEVGLTDDDEVDLAYDTELDDSTQAPRLDPMADELSTSEDIEGSLERMNTLPGLKGFTIPMSAISKPMGEAQPTFLQSEDYLRKHMGTDDLPGTTRELLRACHGMLQEKLDPSVANRAMRTASAETRKALLELTGEGDFGHQYRYWLDELVHRGRFKQREEVGIGGRVETNYRAWNRMKRLIEMLLDRHTGEERDYDEVSKHPDFLKVLNRDLVGNNPMVEFTGPKSREERKQIRRMFEVEGRNEGRTKPCPECDDSGRSRKTGEPCKNTVGEGDEIARCSGMNRFSPVGRGRLVYEKPFRPSAESSKAKIDSLRGELLGRTKYVLKNERNGKHTEIDVVGKADPDYVPPEGMEVLEVGSYIPGLIQEAHDYDKEVAHGLGYMTLCPRCKGSGNVEGATCPTCSGPYTKEEGGKRYIPDTRMLRELNAGSREEGVSSTQSALSMGARRKALAEYARLEMRRRGGSCQECGKGHPSLPDGCQCSEVTGGFQPSHRMDERRHGILTSLENRSLPSDANTNPFEIHPLLAWPDYHRVNGPMTFNALKANFKKVNRDPDAFKRRYREYFENIAQNLTGMERSIVDSNKPSLAVECDLFKRITDSLRAGDDHLLQLCHNLVSIPDIDGRNRHIDPGYLTNIECRQCKGTGYTRYGNESLGHFHLCDGCKGTKSEGVHQWIKRNPEIANEYSDNEIRQLHSQGKLERERNSHSSLVDNAHISLHGRMCDTCRCGQSHAIYDSDKTNLDLITGGRRDDTFVRGKVHEFPQCKKCGKYSKVTDVDDNPCQCPDGFEALPSQVIREENPTRMRAAGASRSSIFRRPERMLPAHRPKPALYQRTQADLRRLMSLMKEVRRVGEHGGQRDTEAWLKFWNPDTGKVEDMTYDKFEGKMQELVNIVRQQHVRDAWAEKYKKTPNLPEFGPDVSTPERLGWKEEGGYYTDAAGNTKRLAMVDREKDENGDDISMEESAMDLPCQWCLRKNRHHQHHDVPTLREHMEEAKVANESRPLGPLHESALRCPRAMEEFEALRADNDHHGIPSPPPILGMRDEYVRRTELHKQDPNLLIYENLMHQLEPHLRSVDSGAGYDPFSKTMKAIKEGQALSIPMLQSVPARLLVSARSSTMEGGNPYGRGSPMSPHDGKSSALPESLDDTMAFLRGAERSLPSTANSIRECKRLIAMHILHPEMRADAHENILNLQREYRDGEGALSGAFIERLREKDRIPRHERFLWAMRVLNKNTSDIRLTKAEEDEFNDNFGKINPLLKLDYEWNKYLSEEGHRVKALMGHPALNTDVDEEHPIFNSIFNFKADEHDSESLFHVGMGPGLYDNELDWIDLVLDTLNRNAEHRMIGRSSAHYGADEHGFMQPYEHHPSMWSFFYGDDSMSIEDPSERSGLGHYPPHLMKAWIDHDTDTLREFGEEFDVEGKSLEQMRESGILDTFWKGITGGRDAWRQGYEIDPTNDAEIPVWKKLFDGKKFPTLDEMMELGDREYHAYKGAWYHLRREMMMRSSMPEVSKERLRRSGQFQAPVGLNTLGTGTRCMMCQGHGVHHSADEAAILHGILHPYEDDYGNHISLPSVETEVMGYFDDFRNWIEDPENESGKAQTRTMRTLLPTHDGSGFTGAGDGWEGRINWADPIAKAFIHNELKTPYGHDGEGGWDEYYSMMLKHNPEIQDFEQDWLTAHEYACVGCHGTGHCGGCAGSGTHERDEDEQRAVLDIHLLMTLMHDRGVGIEIGDDGITRYMPENAVYQKPTQSNIGVEDNDVPLGQRRKYFDGLPPEYEPMDMVDDREDGSTRSDRIGGLDDWKEEFDKVRAKAFDRMIHQLNPNAPSTLDWKDEDRERWYQDNGFQEMYGRHKVLAENETPDYPEWRLDQYVDRDPAGYHTRIRNVLAGIDDPSFRPVMDTDTEEEEEEKRSKKRMATFQMWPVKGKSATFAEWLDHNLHPGESKTAHSSTAQQHALTNKLLQLPADEIARMMYAHFDARENGSLGNATPDMLLESIPWFTPSHKQALMDTGAIYPPNHFDEWEARGPQPLRCQHQSCSEMSDCMYCNATGKVVDDEGNQHDCPPCEGSGEYMQAKTATHGPDLTGTQYNEDGNFCKHHHDAGQREISRLSQEDMEPVRRRIVGGDFARKLIRFTNLNAQDLLDKTRELHSDSVTDDEMRLSGISRLIDGLAFLGLHKVVGQQGQADYFVPMFERGGQKFSIFDLGLAHTTNFEGSIGQQYLFQKRDDDGGYHRSVDLFDHAGWSETGIGNAMPGIKTSERDDGMNLRSIEPDYSPFKVSQYAYPKSHQMCPNCKGVLSSVRGSDKLFHECTNPMTGSDYTAATEGYDGTDKCNWPGRRLDSKERKERLDNESIPSEIHSRDFLIHPNGEDSPEHVRERDERERLRYRLRAIASGDGDPAIVNGRLNRIDRQGSHPVVNHRGEPVLDNDGKVVRRVSTLPADTPFCSWYSYNGLPSYAAEEYEPADVERQEKVEDFLEQFERACYQYEDGVLVTDKNGKPKIDRRDVKMMYQLEMLLKENFRIPVMHRGFGSNLGTDLPKDYARDAYKGLTTIGSIQSLHNYVNDKFKEQTLKAKRESRGMMSMIADVDHKGRFNDMMKVGGSFEHMGRVSFPLSQPFRNYMNKLQEKYQEGKLPSNLEEEKVKRLLDHYMEDPETGISKMQAAFETHIMNENQQKYHLRLPRFEGIVSIDNDMTAETMDPDRARRLLNRLDSGHVRQPPIFREGANADMVSAHRDKTFGVRPQKYHDIMSHYAERAHDHAISFQTSHFPFQAALESLGRGSSVQQQVSDHLRDMRVLNANSHIDVLNQDWLHPEMRPEQSVSETRDERGRVTDSQTTTSNFVWDKNGEHDPSNSKQWYIHANRDSPETEIGEPMFSLDDAGTPQPPRSAFDAQQSLDSQ